VKPSHAASGGDQAMRLSTPKNLHALHTVSMSPT
jgi:hypothetical protein